MPDTFSKRHGFSNSANTEITVREDAPEGLRSIIPVIARKAGMTPHQIREIVCELLLIQPDPGNWSAYPNVWNEVNYLLEKCSWFEVYDIAEALHRAPPSPSVQVSTQFQAEAFADDLNKVFHRDGIGWEMQGGSIVFRGSEVFSESTKEAVTALKETGRTRAANEIHEALQDISRRPEPDTTGAMQHAMAALEATARDVLRLPNFTLGKLIPKLELPEPLDTGVNKLWGYASDRARHVREGQAIDTTEAELLVSVACAVCTFLARRNQP